MLTPDHPVRAVWEFVAKMDLTHWTSAITSKRGMAGAKTCSTHASSSLDHGRSTEFARRANCRDLPPLRTKHRWICGDGPMQYHSLSDFRNSDPAWLENLLARTVAAMHAGAADLKKVAQDGMQVRADAVVVVVSAKKTLQECLAEAEEQIAAQGRSGRNTGDAGESTAHRLGRSRTEENTRGGGVVEPEKGCETKNADRYAQPAERSRGDTGFVDGRMRPR